MLGVPAVALAVTGILLALVAIRTEAVADPGVADPVAELRRQAAEARAKLEADTRRFEGEQRALAGAQSRLRETLKELGAAQAEYDRIRQPLARLINAAYQSGLTGSTSVFAGARGGLGAAADLIYLTNARYGLVAQADRLRARRERLAAEAQDQQSRDLVDQAAVARDLDVLRQQSDQLTRRLTEALGLVGPEGKLAAECDPTFAGDARKFPNGLIPAKYLCSLPQPGRMLRADAALAFFRMNVAYQRRFRVGMCLRDSYRSLADQQRIYAARPGFAAIPGRSNHGLGTAVDLCGGVETQGSPQFNWLVANSKKYGWSHPQWAYSSPFEPWHWEYDYKSGDSPAVADPGAGN